ncbi:MAG: hypothetical protein BGO26_11495 [Actinobacteria bacterium 69-20]|jgi:very-short-patch-repair endonuclease|nr:DUF559 domain-containing protein [Actinomycetota bacterium]OJV26541.1 MAG: hypothetical protein BGO26_11495 [Actinobacteria bacterium 69-20]
MRAKHEPRLLQSAATLDIRTLLARQSGTLLRAQALATGLPRERFDQMVRSRQLVRVLPSVYTNRDPADPAVRLWAAWLWAGESAVIGGGAALFGHGVIDRMPRAITIYVPVARARLKRDPLRLIRTRLDPRDVGWHKGIRFTTPARTCLDLARWGERNDYLEAVLRRNLTSPDALRTCAQRMATVQGYDRAFTAAIAVVTRPWSHPERVLHGVLTDAGVTGWVANDRTQTATGTVFPDIGFPDIKLAIEINGKRYHDEAVDPNAFERDHRREQALVDAGWIVIRFTAKQIERDPMGVLHTILQAVNRLRGVAA